MPVAPATAQWPTIANGRRHSAIAAAPKVMTGIRPKRWLSAGPANAMKAASSWPAACKAPDHRGRSAETVVHIDIEKYADAVLGGHLQERSDAQYKDDGEGKRRLLAVCALRFFYCGWVAAMAAALTSNTAADKSSG